jgi:hypothetical protein
MLVSYKRLEVKSGMDTNSISESKLRTAFNDRKYRSSNASGRLCMSSTPTIAVTPAPAVFPYAVRPELAHIL